MALALYRKYRPKKVEDLVGQEELVMVLKNAARRDTLAHAYLLYGPRGSGKTTTARLIAKLVNCETRAKDAAFRKKGEPCNECRPCEEIDSGRALDVIEIDAASNRGIDEIRNLKEGIKLSPTSYRFKVFIIDEVHQLTKDAFNALLKTLEEPPAHAVFVLATTEYEKVPATISSRTQRFHFRKVSIAEIVKKLKSIVGAEKLKITDDALELIASASEGSFRDAESLLDQIASLEDEITSERIETLIGKIGFRRTAELADLMLRGKKKEALQYLASIQESGFNVVELTKELIHYLRRALTLHENKDLGALFKNELTDKEFKELEKHSALVDPTRHIPLITALIRAYSEMRYSPFASIPLEVVIMEHLRS